MPSFEMSVMESLPTSTKLSYQELEALCGDLQARVERNLAVQQNLVDLKNELDKELDRFRLIEDFGNQALAQTSLEDFYQITVEFFVQIFEQPRCFIAEYDDLSNCLTIKGSIGFNITELPKQLAFNATYIDKKSTVLLNNCEGLSRLFEAFDFANALFCPFYIDGALRGIILCGHGEEDQDYYEIKSQNRHAFTLMAEKTGFLLRSLQSKAQLKQKIEAHQQSEKLLELQTNELIQSNKDLDQFASIAAHHLKNPLRTISSFAQLIAKQYHKYFDVNGRKYLNFLIRDTKRLHQVTEDLYKFSRLEAYRHKFELVNLHQILQITAKQLAPAIRKQKAKIKVHQQFPKVMSHALLIQMLFAQLLENALKFSQPDQPIEINLSVKKQHDHFLFSFQDNGIGIEEKDLAKMFILFEQLNDKELFEGDGVGLALCQKIVSWHKGKIWATSDGKNSGCTFYFTLPIPNI